MNKNLTDITVILDRSGSMHSCVEEAQGGLKAFIEAQQKLPGDANFTLVQFDDQYEVVHRGIPLKDVPEFKLVPRGWTALYDAVGKTINDIGVRLDKLKEEDRPGLVVVVIVTDGWENASKEFSADQVRKMIQHQESKYSWKFTYLGANQDVFKAARFFGINTSAVSNYSTSKSADAFLASSNSLARLRSAVGSGVVASSLTLSYTEEERKRMS